MGTLEQWEKTPTPGVGGTLDILVPAHAQETVTIRGGGSWPTNGPVLGSPTPSQL